jgi:hypothetical protein
MAVHRFDERNLRSAICSSDDRHLLSGRDRSSSICENAEQFLFHPLSGCHLANTSRFARCWLLMSAAANEKKIPDSEQSKKG